MNGKTPKNIAASVRQRLLNKARHDKRPFTELLQYFAMERFLYRLSHIPGDFAEIMRQIKIFLDPILESIRSGKATPSDWKAPGSWE